jgi:hypothetical protein
MKPEGFNESDKCVSLRLAIALLTMLLAVYGFSFSGRFSTDDEHILAARSLGLAFQGSLNNDRVLGNDRIFFYSNRPAEQATAGLAIEPLQSILGAGLVQWAELLGSGHVQTLFLLNIFVAAFASLCVFASIRILGFPNPPALVGTLFFALGTPVWVYSRTFFRDPLAMFFLAFAWLCALQLNRAKTSGSQILAAIGILLGLILGILSKNTVTLAIPSFFVLLMPFWKTLRDRGTSYFKRMAFPTLVLLVGIMFLLFLARGSLARFSFRYYLQVIDFFFTVPHPNFLPAVLGPLISPGKSLFIYAPVILLSIPPLLRKQYEALSAWLYVLLLITAQALFYDALWWGSVNWGLRFLLPVLPPLVIAAASVIHHLLGLAKGRVTLVLLGVFSILIQAVGLVFPLGKYYRAMMEISPQAPGSLGVWSLGHTPLIWQVKWFFTGESWDLAVLRIGWAGLLIVIFFIFLVGLTIVKHRTKPLWISILLAVLSGLAILVLPKAYMSDSAYYPDRNDLKSVQEDLSTIANQTDGLVITSYGAPAWLYWMNWGSGSPEWVSLPYSLGLDEPLESTKKILSRTTASHARTWVLLPCDSPLSVSLTPLKNQFFGLNLLSERVYQVGDCRTTLLLLGSH